MKPTHLKTLSATVDELYSLVAYGKITEPQFCNLISELNDDLKQPVNLAHFVRCDANGVPLEKLPKRIYLDNKTQTDRYHEWHEAQKSVIFEGWEVLKPNRFGDFVVHNKEHNTTLEFLENGINCKVYFGLNQSMNTHVKSLADLAAATTENPLKLK